MFPLDQNAISLADEVALMSDKVTGDYIAVSMPTDSYATIAALSMAILRCAHPVRRYRLAEALAVVCRVQADTKCIPTA